MAISGKAWKFGDDVNTDLIIAARYLNLAESYQLAEHLMEDADPDFPSKVRPGDIMVAGKNFGCGSSREHAPVAIKAAGITCVIAKSFARIFFRNAFNMGLMIFESPEAADSVQEGHEIQVDPEEGTIRNVSTGETFKVAPIPDFMKGLLNDGGLIRHISKTAGQEEDRKSSGKD